MWINGPVSQIITIIRSSLIGCKGFPQRGFQMPNSFHIESRLFTHWILLFVCHNWGKILFFFITKTSAPRRNQHIILKRATILITCSVWGSHCHGCTCVGVHKLWVFCVHNYVCIYSTGELISLDLALQAFPVPAVPTAATMYLIEYNILNNAHICRGCVNLSISTGSNYLQL